MPDTKVVFEESQAGLNSAKLKTIADKADIIVFPKESFPNSVNWIN